ncbi:DUF192 domain-containing protein [Halegenticoccus tardaugens]|uniref:DUF192 domain-containing protein n=1 Tax=Halegenticoccus tardaugens TaxID=2071624 RepID=UPI00100A80E0|nr:DUF192 domain-containing protein [Halegenticoccus tardaugens]
MVSRRTLAVLAAVALLAVAGVGAAYAAGLFSAGEYDRTTVTVVDDEDGTKLATVEVRVADTPQKRYTGLSDTASLDDGEGMLFVHPAEGDHAYVMRDMAFPLDIVFVDADGTITRIHHAPLPSEGTDESDLKRYEGRGKYVLEVPYGYTNRTGVDAGDRVTIRDWD